MAKYAQNTTTGHTCPWGSADDNLPPDAFTLAARKAATKRRDSQDSNSSSVVLAHTPACLAAAGAGYNTGRGVERDELVAGSVAVSTSRSSVKSGGYDGKATGRSTTSLKAKEVELEKKMMDLISQCLDKKVLELRQPPKACTDDAASVGSSTARSETVMSTARSSQIETARKQATTPKVSKAKSIEKGGYEALERYPALLKEVKGLSATKKDVPEGLTSNGKQKQAMKLSEASLGKFDADESRLAYLEMQKSAAEARNKNRSALCFGDDTGNAGPAAAHKDVTMADKRDRAKKLSDASLGKFDADQSQIAYLDMQNTAAEMRAKNRVGQGIF